MKCRANDELHNLSQAQTQKNIEMKELIIAKHQEELKQLQDKLKIEQRDTDLESDLPERDGDAHLI